MKRETLIGLALKGSAALAAQTIVSRALAAVTMVFVARLLGPREMAVWAVVSGVAGIGWTLADLGMGASLVRGRTEPDPLAFRQAGGLQIASFLVLLVGGLAVWWTFAGSVSWAPELPMLVLIVGSGMLLRGLATPAKAWLERHMRFTALAIVDSISSIAQNVTLVSGLVLHLGIWSFAVSAIIGDLTTLFALWTVARAPILLPAAGLRAIRPYISFGLALQLHNIAHLARESLTPLILARALGPTVAGLWAWVRKLLELLYSFLGIGWRITFAAYARMASVDDRQKSAAMVLRVTHWPLVLLAVALIGTGSWSLNAIFGSQWQAAHPALYLTLATLAFSGPVSVALAGGVLADGGAAKLALAQVVRTLTVWMIALWVGPKWGVLGVAIGWSVQLVEDAVSLLAFAWSWTPSVTWMLRSLGAGLIGVWMASTLNPHCSRLWCSLTGGLLAVFAVVALNFRALTEFMQLSRQVHRSITPYSDATPRAASSPSAAGR